MSTLDPGECVVCGGGGPYRRAGCAEWCDRIRRVLRIAQPRIPADDPCVRGTCGHPTWATGLCKRGYDHSYRQQRRPA